MNKIKIFLIFLVFILIAVPIAWSVTRTISSSQDTVSTFITNSNGKYWEANATNIQAAIDDLAGNGIVWIPAGNFTITNTIYINHSDVTLRGTGGGSYQSGSGATVFTCGATIPDGMISISGGRGGGTFLYNIIIEDIKFNSDNELYETHAITINDAHLCNVERCGFNDFNGSAIRFTGSFYGADILDCAFQTCGGPDYGTIDVEGDIGSNGLTIDNCLFEACWKYSICYKNSHGANHITDNYFESNSIHPSDAFIYGKVGGHTFITGNYFGSSNDELNVIEITSGGYFNIIANNILENSEYGIIVNPGGSQSHTIVSLNNIYDMSEDGIRVCENSTVVGNILRDIGDDGIYAEKGCTVVANSFDNVTGLYVEEGIPGSNLIMGNYGYNFESLFPLYNQSSAPDIPNNTEAWWNDPDGPWFYRVVDYEGTQYYTNMSTSP